MFSRLTPALAEEHIRELRESAAKNIDHANPRPHPRLRARLGWSLMRLGLRIAHQLPPQPISTVRA